MLSGLSSNPSSFKTDDPRTDFYTMYKREAMEYDMYYVKKYDDDLNTTLIFVRWLPCALVNRLTCPLRPVYSLPSAQLSSSMFIQSSNAIRTTNPLPFSALFSSLSISPLSQARLPLSHLPKKIHRARSSLSLGLCMQAC